MKITNIKHENIISSCKDLPNVNSGIYFLIKDNRVVYVGQSIDLLKRSLGGHKSKDFDAVCYIEIDYKINLNNIEAYFIAKFKPKYNSAIPPNKIGVSKVHLIEDFDFTEINSIIEQQYGVFKFENIFKEYENFQDLHLVKEEYNYTDFKLRSAEFRFKEIEKKIEESNRELEKFQKRISSFHELEGKLKQLSEMSSKLHEKLTVHNSFEPDIENWNQKIHGTFGIYIEGILETPFYYFISNNPQQELLNIRSGNPKSQSEIVRKILKYCVEQGIKDKIKINFEEFTDSKNKNRICHKFLFKKGDTCFNNLFFRTKNNLRDNFFNSILNTIDNYKTKK